MIDQLVGPLSRLGVRDLVEIAIVTFLIYRALVLIRGTRGWQMTLGILSLAFFYYLTRLFELRTVEWLLGYLFIYFGFALIVIFQSEIRRGLAELGRGRFLHGMGNGGDNKSLEEVVLAATTLSAGEIGGLIVLEREIGLRNYVESGIELDARLTYDLLVTVFNPASPLHDGAVIIRKNRVLAAACFLPLTLDPYLSKELGTRHRAAIGITEESDAVAIVVSEETSAISIVHRGEMTRNVDGPRLLRILQRIESDEPASSSAASNPSTPAAPREAL